MLIAGLFFMVSNLYAGSGDLIVNGKLGVGTTSPAANRKVDVHAPSAHVQIKSTTGTNAVTLNFNNTGGDFFIGRESSAGNTTFTGAEAYESVLYSQGAYPLGLYTNGIRRIYLASTGNVGIGTTLPGSSRLKISGSNSYYQIYTVNDYVGGDLFTPLVRFQTSDATNRGLWVDVYNAGGVGEYVRLGSLGNVPLSLLPSGGNVGIGTTSPAYKLDVAGQIASNGQVLTSDRKFKKDITHISTALSQVLELNGVSFNWRADEYRNKGFSKGKHYGVIAQEVEKVLPEIVRTDPNGDKAVAYTELIPILIEAVKEQQKQIELQKAEVASLKEQQAMVSTLMEKVDALERQVALTSTVALADE